MFEIFLIEKRKALAPYNMSKDIFTIMLPVVYREKEEGSYDEILLRLAYIVFTPDAFPGCIMALIGII